jgi:regulator of nucleoside diphosphate kinase
MDPAVPSERTLTQTDHARLARLLSRPIQPPVPASEIMQDLLDSSEIVPSTAVPPTVVTMYTQVLLQDEQDGSEFKVTLCYPPDANASTGQLSVLSPIGAALLGLQVNEVARWRAPTGEERRARILSILFQPEAAGDLLR